MENLSLRLTNPMVLFGIGMYALNRLSDMYTGLPIGDLLFPFIVFAFLVKDQSVSRVTQAPGAILLLLLMVAITISNVANSVSFLGQFRNSFAVATLFLPVLFFAAMRNRNAIMAYMVGMVLCVSAFFTVQVLLALAGGEIPRTLRAEQLTPVVPFAYYIVFRHNMGKMLNVSLLIATAASLFITFAIDVRAPLVSIILAAAFYAINRFGPKPIIILSLALGGMLLAHYISSFFIGSSFDAVMESGTESISNMERAYAIDYCRMILEKSPFFGNSPQGYSINFTDFFSYIAGFSEPGDQIASPHNSFLEYAVFFGYPAGFLFVALVCRLFQAGVSGANLGRTLLAALVCAGIIRIGAFYGFSGWLRIEWFALIFAAYYTFQKEGAPQAPEPLVVSSVPAKKRKA